MPASGTKSPSGGRSASESMPEPLEERRRRAEQGRSPGVGLVADLFDVPALHERAQRRVDVDATDRRQLCTRDRLLVGDDRERLERRGRQARVLAFEHEALDVRREIRVRLEAVAAGDAAEHEAAPLALRTPRRARAQISSTVAAGSSTSSASTSGSTGSVAAITTASIARARSLRRRGPRASRRASSGIGRATRRSFSSARRDVVGRRRPSRRRRRGRARRVHRRERAHDQLGEGRRLLEVDDALLEQLEARRGTARRSRAARRAVRRARGTAPNPPSGNRSSTVTIASRTLARTGATWSVRTSGAGFGARPRRAASTQRGERHPLERVGHERAERLLGTGDPGHGRGRDLASSRRRCRAASLNVLHSSRRASSRSRSSKRASSSSSSRSAGPGSRRRALSSTSVAAMSRNSVAISRSTRSIRSTSARYASTIAASETSNRSTSSRRIRCSSRSNGPSKTGGLHLVAHRRPAYPVANHIACRRDATPAGSDRCPHGTGVLGDPADRARCTSATTSGRSATGSRSSRPRIRGRRHDAIYCVVDLHAMTVPYDLADARPAHPRRATLLLAAGLDPDRSHAVRAEPRARAHAS